MGLVATNRGKNTLRILDMFDLYGHKGTFFFLGWVAKHYRNLVKEVSNRDTKLLLMDSTMKM
jgi:peptidoglycan/xylan/chitin deacetylase (PgdA/CDA1 family)